MTILWWRLDHLDRRATFTSSGILDHSDLWIESHAVRELELQRAKDTPIFQAARDAKAVVMTKDSDFLALLDRFGPPPQILWVTCGNTSNARLKEVLTAGFPRAVDLLQQGERLVEISDLSITEQGI